MGADSVRGQAGISGRGVGDSRRRHGDPKHRAADAGGDGLDPGADIVCYALADPVTERWVIDNARASEDLASSTTRPPPG